MQISSNNRNRVFFKRIPYIVYNWLSLAIKRKLQSCDKFYGIGLKYLLSSNRFPSNLTTSKCPEKLDKKKFGHIKPQPCPLVHAY